jgi:RimJ/RimL family protein N-acetyltransferase
MADRFDVRLAKPEDVDALVRMRLALQAHIHEANPHLFAMSQKARSELASRYRAAMADADARVVVVEIPSERKIVAMGLARIITRDDLHPMTFGRVDNVWVDPDYRRQGLCTRMLRRLVDFLEGGRIGHLVLDYVVGSVESEATWRSLGFQPVLTIANAKLADLKRRLHEAAERTK